MRMTTIEQDIKLRKIQFKVEEMAKEIVSMMNEVGIELSDTESLWCTITTCIDPPEKYNTALPNKSFTVSSYIYDKTNGSSFLFNHFMLVEEAKND
jgi:hypothetical protein